MSVLFEPLYQRLSRRWFDNAKRRAAQDSRWAEIEALRIIPDSSSKRWFDSAVGLTREVNDEQEAIFEQINPGRPWFYRLGGWLDEHPWADHPLLELRNFVHRGKRGWAIPDTWMFSHYLARITAEGVDRLRQDRHGHPTGITMDEWETILTEIVAGFRAVEQADDILLPEEEQEAARVEVNKAMDLYKQWFFHLWD